MGNFRFFFSKAFSSIIPEAHGADIDLIFLGELPHTHPHSLTKWLEVMKIIFHEVTT
jgi:hypothetical protein